MQHQNFKENRMNASIGSICRTKNPDSVPEESAKNTKTLWPDRIVGHLLNAKNLCFVNSVVTDLSNVYEHECWILTYNGLAFLATPCGLKYLLTCPSSRKPKKNQICCFVTTNRQEKPEKCQCQIILFSTKIVSEKQILLTCFFNIGLFTNHHRYRSILIFFRHLPTKIHC